MFSKILEHKITLIVAVAACLIVAVGAAFLLLTPQKRALTGVAAQTRDIQESVSADGKLDSDQHVSLSFRQSGFVMNVNIMSVNVSVGDHVYAGETLATADPGTLYASLQGARADVQSAQAAIDALGKGATIQTVSVYNQSVSTASLALTTAVRDSYLKVQDALLNKAGILFNNNTSANPTLVIQAETYQAGLSMNSARVDMTSRLSSWNALLNSSATSAQTIAEATADIAAAKSFADSLSAAVNRLNAANSGLSANVLATYVAAANAVATEVNAADSEFNAALQAYKTSVDQLNVIQASSTPENMEIAQANLAKAAANVASIQSQLSDTILTAPFDGIVASIGLKVGENFPVNAPAIDIVSAGAYKIDVMVPENEVAGIAPGDHADIRFNAGDLTATGTVSTIDLSETVTNGVGAYKATVYVNGSDPRVRTGMSASVTIKGASVGSATAIPSNAVITKDGASYALVLGTTGAYTEQKITTGISDGTWTEVTSGLQASDIVAAFGGASQ